MFDTESVFNVLAADDTDRRVASRRALALAHRRIENHLGAFLRQAADVSEFSARLAACQEEFEGHVATAAEEVGYDKPEYISKSLKDHYARETLHQGMVKEAPGKKHMKGVSDKDNRMYEHIKENLTEDGSDEERAKEEAARTVNKYRKKHHKTKDSGFNGTLPGIADEVLHPNQPNAPHLNQPNPPAGQAGTPQNLGLPGMGLPPGMAEGVLNNQPGQAGVPPVLPPPNQNQQGLPGSPPPVQPGSMPPMGIFGKRSWTPFLADKTSAGYPTERQMDDYGGSGYGGGDYDDPDSVRCPTCGGEGQYLGSLGRREHYRCRHCGTDFSNEDLEPHYASDGEGTVTCPECGGEGKTVGGKSCPKCRGKGRVNDFGPSVLDQLEASVRTSEDGNQGNTGLGGPEPKIDKRKWTPENVGNPDPDSKYHPNHQKDLLVPGRPTNEEELKEIGEQTTERQKLPTTTDFDGSGFNTDQKPATNTKRVNVDGTADPVTRDALT